MPNAKITAQEQEAAAKRYAAYAQQVEAYNASLGSVNPANEAMNKQYQAEIDNYNKLINAATQATPYVQTIDQTGGVQLSDGRYLTDAPGAKIGHFLISETSSGGDPEAGVPPTNTYRFNPTALIQPVAPNYAEPAAVGDEPKPWNPSLAALNNMRNPVVDAGTAEVIAAKGGAANAGIVGSYAERSKQLEDPNEKPLTSNKGILARVLGGEL